MGRDEKGRRRTAPGRYAGKTFQNSLRRRWVFGCFLWSDANRKAPGWCLPRPPGGARHDTTAPTHPQKHTKVQREAGSTLPWKSK